MLQYDLAVAGIKYEVNGMVIDFHALLHTFCTHLSTSGVASRVA